MARESEVAVLTHQLVAGSPTSKHFMQDEIKAKLDQGYVIQFCTVASHSATVFTVLTILARWVEVEETQAMKVWRLPQVIND